MRLSLDYLPVCTLMMGIYDMIRSPHHTTRKASIMNLTIVFRVHHITAEGGGALLIYGDICRLGHL